MPVVLMFQIQVKQLHETFETLPRAKEVHLQVSIKLFYSQTARKLAPLVLSPLSLCGILLFSQPSMAERLAAPFGTKGLSEKTCTQVFQKLRWVQPERIEEPTLKKALYYYSIECGLMPGLTEVSKQLWSEQDIESELPKASVLFEIQPDQKLEKFLAQQVETQDRNDDSPPSLYVLWDASDQTFSFDERAKLTADFTLPASLKRVRLKSPLPTAAEIKTTLSGETATRLTSEPKGGIFHSITKRLSRARSRIDQIYREGDWEFVGTAYAWHNRQQYTREKIEEFNEVAAGLGFEYVVINENGNREAVGAFLHLDSHNDIQINAGYEWGKRLVFGKNSSAWAGFSAGVFIRKDYSYLPLPFILPSAGLKIGKLSFRGVYIPSFSGGNNGNVVFLYMSYEVDRL